MWGLSSWVIVLHPELSRVMAAWTGAPACPLAPEPRKQMVADEGEEGRSRQERHACCPTPGRCRYVCPQPCGVAALQAGPHSCPGPGTLTDPRTSSQSCLSPQTPTPSLASEIPYPALSAACSSSSILRKPKRERAALLAQDTPRPQCEAQSFPFMWLLSRHDHPCGRSYF